MADSVLKAIENNKNELKEIKKELEDKNKQAIEETKQGNIKINKNI